MYLCVLFSFFNDRQSYDTGKMDKLSVPQEMLVRIMLNIAEVGSRNIVYVIVRKL